MYLREQDCKRLLIAFCIIILVLLVTEGNVSARRYLYMKVPRLDFGLSYEFEEEERKGPDIDQKRRSSIFFEGFDLRTDGWLYHPALLVYDLKISPEWEQEREEFVPDNILESRTFLQGYDTSLTFLQNKPYTLNLFARKDQFTISSNFIERSKMELQNYGGTFFLKYPVLPTTFDYRHTDRKQTGFFSSEEGRDDFSISMRYHKHLGQTSLNASYSDSETSNLGQRINTVEKKVNIINFSEPSGNISLQSNLDYSDLEGDFRDHERRSVNEALTWKHRKELTTVYNFQYSKNIFEATLSESTGLGFNLIHRLYENLTTSININGDKNRFAGNEDLKYGGALNFNYRRKIPWGFLNLKMGQGYRIVESDVEEDFVFVSGESVTLNTGTVTLLENQNVSLNSIEVWNTARTIQYTENVDYRLTLIDTFVRISRMASGGILDGDTVFVDYDYLSNPSADISTYTQSYGGRISLRDTWDIYYDYRRSQEDVLSGMSSNDLINDRIQTAGTEVRWNGTKSRFEYIDKDTTNVPTREWIIDESITFRPTPKIYLSLSGNYGETRFMDTEETETFSGLRSTVQFLLSKKSWFSTEGFWRKVLGDNEDNEDWGVSSKFEWIYKKLNANIQYKFTREGDGITQETIKNHYVLLEIKTARF